MSILRFLSGRICCCRIQLSRESRIKLFEGGLVGVDELQDRGREVRNASLRPDSSWNGLVRASELRGG